VRVEASRRQPNPEELAAALAETARINESVVEQIASLVDELRELQQLNRGMLNQLERLLERIERAEDHLAASMRLREH
jgi:predicted  nucleic acid-binding Zn-ribbon protein